MSETNIEERLRVKVKEKGGRAYKFVSPGNSGVPDRMIVLPFGRLFFIELKSETGKPTINQLKQIRKLKKLGCTATVIGSIEAVDEFIKVCDHWPDLHNFITRQDEKYGI